MVHSPEHPVVMQNALRRLAEEARQRLASLAADDPERPFYVGVMSAAEDLGRSGHVSPRALQHEPAQFREGYLEVSSLAAAAVGHVPSRLPLPTPRT